MSKVILDMTMSLDGFIAGLKDETKPLHDWLFNGNVKSAYTDYFRLSKESAKIFDELIKTTGSIITGRRTYDFTNGWKGNHPVNNSVFVVSHSVPKKIPKGATKFTFVTDGIESAVKQARKAARKKNVYLMGGANVVQQCLKAGFIDGMTVHLVPVLLASGIPLFEHLGSHKIRLVQTKIIKAPGITHMKFNFIK